MLFLILYHLFYIELRGISVLYTYTFLFDILDSPPFGYLSSGDDNPITSSRRDENDMSSSLYRLEIVGIELLSLYGAEVCFCHLSGHLDVEKIAWNDG